MPDRAAGRWRGWQRTLPVMRGVLPIERSRVPADVLAGFTLAALGITKERALAWLVPVLEQMAAAKGL